MIKSVSIVWHNALKYGIISSLISSTHSSLCSLIKLSIQPAMGLLLILA